MTQEVANQSHVASETATVVKQRSTETTVVDENTVFCRYTTQLSDGNSIAKATTLDFSNVSREQLLELCCGQGLVVRLQRMLRNLDKAVAADPKTFREVVVLNDIIGATRTRLPSDELAIRLLAKKHGLSEDELRSFLAANAEVLQVDNTSAE
jgi:hypothetical protein